MKLITRMPKIDPTKVTPEVAQLLSIIELQIKEIQLLKDEIARLKGQNPKPKPKPKIKPSILEKPSSTGKKKKRKKRKKSVAYIRYDASVVKRFFFLTQSRWCTCQHLLRKRSIWLFIAENGCIGQPDKGLL